MKELETKSGTDIFKRRNRIAVDIDGTLTNDSVGQWWTNSNISPNREAIEFINSLYKSGLTILIHTSRPEEARVLTEVWLKEHKVKYHALVMDKLPADVYIDDKAIGNIKVNFPFKTEAL